jgi:hypothetical protein
LCGRYSTARWPRLKLMNVQGVLALFLPCAAVRGTGAWETMNLRRHDWAAGRRGGPIAGRCAVRGWVSTPSIRGRDWVERYRQRTVRVSRGLASQAAIAARLSGSAGAGKASW